MRARVNLFRNVKRVSAKSPSVNLEALKEVKVGFAFLYGVGLTTVLLSVVVIQYRNHKRNLEAVTAKLQEISDQQQMALNELGAKTEAYQKRIREAKTVKPAIEVLPEIKAVVSVNLDKTWSSVLWKLSTMTIDPVVIQRMDMSRAGDSDRKVDITGQAESLAEFKEWLETLNKYLPGSDFIVENQAVSEKGKEIRFKLTARIS